MQNKKRIILIALIAVLWVAAAAVILLVYPDIAPKETEETTETEAETETLSEEEQKLMNKYPKYFGLDTSEGLDAYVCQLAGNHYEFVLFEHTEEERDYAELLDRWRYYRATPEEMRQILAIYDISPEAVNIRPWINPFSSYIDPYHAMLPTMPADTPDAYIYNIWLMLFDDSYLKKDAYYSTFLCDIDSDGKNEICTLGLGEETESSLYTFTAREAGQSEPEYRSIIAHEGAKSLQLHDEIGTPGIRIAGQDTKDRNKWHLLSVTFENGVICVYEDGVKLNIE